MKTTLLSCFILLFFEGTVAAQQPTIAELLGYPADAILLIIHADDLGVTHSENMASIKGLEESSVNSASIMVPCPWFPEIAAYAQEHKETDFGLHLTLNSEWKYYRWGPVTSKDSVPSLLDAQGYLHGLPPATLEHADVNEVALELRNQVLKAYRFGIDVTHLDSHMFALFNSVEMLKAYIQVGRAFQIPVLLDNSTNMMKGIKKTDILTDKDIVVDRILSAEPDDYKQGMTQYYKDVLTNLKPGLNCLLIHLAYDNEEMQAVTVDNKNWGAAWRQADFDFFTSKECEELLAKNKIVLVTWRELRDTIVRGK